MSQQETYEWAEDLLQKHQAITEKIKEAEEKLALNISLSNPFAARPRYWAHIISGGTII